MAPRPRKPSGSLYLPVAVRAAREAGKLLLASYGRLRRTQIAAKAKNDFVTAIDKASEKRIISVIRRSFPGHSFLGEEGGRQAGEGALWIIDPLDGTSNYIHQLPLFCVSIGVAEAGRPVAAVVYDPTHGELFTAVRGAGAFLNGRRIRVSPTADLADGFLATGFPFRARGRFDQYLRAFDTLTLASAGLRRGGSAALDLAYVACGRYDGFWEMDLSPWDIAAGALLVEEAGGRMSDFWGADAYLASGDVLASNGRVHRRMQSLTAAAFRPKQAA